MLKHVIAIIIAVAVGAIGYAFWTKKESEGQDLDSWTTDTCHPNPLGHQTLSQQILPVITEILAPLPKLQEPTAPKR